MSFVSLVVTNHLSQFSSQDDFIEGFTIGSNMPLSRSLSESLLIFVLVRAIAIESVSAYTVLNDPSSRWRSRKYMKSKNRYLDHCKMLTPMCDGFESVTVAFVRVAR